MVVRRITVSDLKIPECRKFVFADIERDFQCMLVYGFDYKELQRRMEFWYTTAVFDAVVADKISN